MSVDPFLGKHTTKYQSSHRYWTILVLKPAFLDPYVDKDVLTNLQDSRVPSQTMESTVLGLIADTLRHIDLDWTELCQHTERILSASEKVFSSTFSDSSLFDDDDFSSSRKYTWLIISLGEFEALISANIHTWKEYEAECLMPYLNDESEVSPLERRSTKQTLSKIAKIVQNLQRTKEQFVRQRNMSVDLRDGLFAASSVRESQTSTRLARMSTQVGENIKLLTYVSIFYLPLSFCTSIWSTSDTLGYSALVVTTVIVGLGTYLVVLNIQGLAAICSKHYENHKRRIIERMKSDETWKTLGHRFEQTGLERAKLESPPSDWLLAVTIEASSKT
ncbi:MAG: hypothetical protein LQ345_005415 [Seirophora villosa]|nr:MAG: hypothetical protein LQ345_005415 [Seirophora villosa]